MAASKNLKALRFFVAVTILFGFLSCAEKTSSAKTEPPPGGVLVTVVDYSDLDGCTFLLQLADGQKLQPVNLDEPFRKKDLKLYITFKNHDGMSTCMAGRMVTLTSVTVTKDDQRK